jgi:hypothetical protein
LTRHTCRPLSIAAAIRSVVCCRSWPPFRGTRLQVLYSLNLVRDRDPAPVQRKKSATNSRVLLILCFIHVQLGLPPTLSCRYHFWCP